MALQKQYLSLTFGQGLDQKTDPKQVPMGKFQSLVNSVFNKMGLLTKRNGFAQLTGLPDDTSVYATTFNGNLTAIGNKLEAYSSGTNTWVNKGYVQPALLSVQSLIKTGNNQSQVDAAVSESGLVCTAYTDSVSGSNVYKYAVFDSTTGQNVIAPTTLTNGTGSPKVFLLGNYFIVVFTSTITATPHLQYVAINKNTLLVGSITDISTTYTPSTTVNFDGVVSNSRLFLAWNGSDGGGAVRMNYLDANLNLGSGVTFATEVATLMSVTADDTQPTPVIYASYYNLGTTTGRVLAINPFLGTVHAPTTWIAAGTILNVTSSAQSGSVNIFYETSNAYTYDSNIKTNFVSKKAVTQAGSVGSASVVLRSVGLASKSFILDSVIYFLVTYSSSTQPTYFIIDSTGNILGKLAYSNGGGYLVTGLPSVTLIDSDAYVGYLFKDLVQAVNKDQGASNSGLGVYTQTGINLAKWTIGTSDVVSAESGKNLHLTGGQLWMYDGFQVVEHGFHLWPDSVEITGSTTSGSMIAQQYFYQALYTWTDNQGNIHQSAPSLPVSFTILTPPATFVGNRTSGSAIISSIASTALLQAGQAITGTGIPASTYILSVDSSSQITMTQNASSGSATATTITPSILTSVTVNIPTLRVTLKTTNAVNITVYRWSTAQQTYYQTTTISSPLVNSTTVDQVSFTDSHSDAQIVGNEIIYTTGGVIENIGAPSFSSIALFKDRLFGIDSEDSNLLWYSKQVVEATPVEMSDLFTVFCSPTDGAQSPTGPIRCVSGMDDKLIIFKDNAIYYITGNGPDNTGTNNDFSGPIFITSTVGCNNQQSIVFIPQGLMFQSSNGIWLLGRDLNTQYIGKDVENYNSYDVLSAVNIPGTTQVRFNLSNGTVLMYDYFFGQWGTFAGIPAVSSTIFEGAHTFINSSGSCFQENPGSYLDGSNPVLMSFTTSWIKLAGVQGYQRAYWLNLLGDYISPHKLSVSIAYDYGPNRQMTPITPDNNNNLYGGDPFYGSTFVYGGNLPLEDWQLFFQRQRCMGFQVSVNEMFDASIGQAAGAGLTLSEIRFAVGLKSGNQPTTASRSTG